MNLLTVLIAIITVFLMLTLNNHHIPSAFKSNLAQGAILVLILLVATSNMMLALLLAVGYLIIFKDTFNLLSNFPKINNKEHFSANYPSCLSKQESKEENQEQQELSEPVGLTLGTYHPVN